MNSSGRKRKRRPARKTPISIDLYMRGRAAMIQWTQKQPTKDSLVAVRAWFDRALEIDPNDADALAGEATTYLAEYTYGWTNPETDYDAKILGPVDRSIALASDNMLAYTTKSVYLAMSLRPNDALRVADTGLVINPNSASSTRHGATPKRTCANSNMRSPMWNKQCG